jgi:hypothetical protein
LKKHYNGINIFRAEEPEPGVFGSFKPEPEPLEYILNNKTKSQSCKNYVATVPAPRREKA